MIAIKSRVVKVGHNQWTAFDHMSVGAGGIALAGRSARSIAAPADHAFPGRTRDVHPTVRNPLSALQGVMPNDLLPGRHRGGATRDLEGQNVKQF